MSPTPPAAVVAPAQNARRRVLRIDGSESSSKEMGVILGIAVLLDAALVRLVLVPVMLRLLGTWAWWLPGPLCRPLPAVRFGHA